MDPTANLKEQLELSKEIQLAFDSENELDVGSCERLAELVLALHEWIIKGGALPAQWQTKREQLTDSLQWTTDEILEREA